jgi:hypothetical protein
MGLPVISVSEALQSANDGLIDDTELAVRGFYLPLAAGTPCSGPATSGQPDVRSVRSACHPETFGRLRESPAMTVDPVTGAVHPVPAGPGANSLETLIAPDVPFDLPGSFEGRLEPLPVVIVGHFGDRRAASLFEQTRFVVDALVWRAGARASLDPVNLASPVESAAAVRARVDAELGPANASWLSVVAGSQLPAIEPGLGVESPELLESPATWIVRRLVVTERLRPVVRRAYVADGSDRVWKEPGSD